MIFLALRAWVLAKLVLLAALALALVRCGGSSGPTPPPPPPPPQAAISMAPEAWQFEYSPGMPAHPTAAPGGGWQFELPLYRPPEGKDVSWCNGGPDPACVSVNYLTTAPSILAGRTLHIAYQLDASDDAVIEYRLNPNNTCDAPPALALYFQRAGDNLSFPFYRWWGPAIALERGAHEVSVSLADRGQWIATNGTNGSVASGDYDAAIANVARVGMTWGGGCFRGHGLNLSAGSARVTITTFSTD